MHADESRKAVIRGSACSAGHGLSDLADGKGDGMGWVVDVWGWGAQSKLTFAVGSSLIQI